MPSAPARSAFSTLGPATALPRSSAAVVSAARRSAVLAEVGPAAGALLLVAAVAVTGFALYLWWPAGIAAGLVLGLVTSVVLGTRMQAANRSAPADEDLAARLGIVAAPAAEDAPAAAPVVEAVLPDLQPLPDVLYFEEGDVREVADAPDGTVSVAPVRDGLAKLKDELGEDYTDFARAARLVVSTQYASAARLQRDLKLPYSRARRLLTDLEQQHFVGPATGSLPRQVLMPKDQLPEVERLLAV